MADWNANVLINMCTLDCYDWYFFLGVVMACSISVSKKTQTKGRPRQQVDVPIIIWLLAF